MFRRLGTLFRPYTMRPEEELVVICREDWRGLIPVGCLSGLVMIGSAAAVLYAGRLSGLSKVAMRGIGMALATVSLLIWFFVVLRWYFNVLIVTDRRIVVRRGMVKQDVWEAPILKVQSVTTAVDFASRIIGVGELRIETGALYGAITFRGIRRVETVSDQISTLLTMRKLEREVMELEDVKLRLRQRLRL